MSLNRVGTAWGKVKIMDRAFAHPTARADCYRCTRKRRRRSTSGAASPRMKPLVAKDDVE
jgi:hypothetical protein